jgi:hypothetical protein
VRGFGLRGVDPKSLTRSKIVSERERRDVTDRVYTRGQQGTASDIEEAADNLRIKQARRLNSTIDFFDNALRGLAERMNAIKPGTP